MVQGRFNAWSSIFSPSIWHFASVLTETKLSETLIGKYGKFTQPHVMKYICGKWVNIVTSYAQMHHILFSSKLAKSRGCILYTGKYGIYSDESQWSVHVTQIGATKFLVLAHAICKKFNSSSDKASDGLLTHASQRAAFCSASIITLVLRFRFTLKNARRSQLMSGLSSLLDISVPEALAT